jgi:hypothetical protein
MIGHANPLYVTIAGTTGWLINMKQLVEWELAGEKYS